MNSDEINALIQFGVPKELIPYLGKCVKGIPLSASTGSTPLNVQIPGSAKVFLGFAVVDTVDNDFTIAQISLNLNNEQIIDRMDLSFCTPNQRSLQPNGYVGCLRKMSGKDVMNFEVTTSASRVMQFAVYYCNGMPGKLFPW